MYVCMYVLLNEFSGIKIHISADVLYSFYTFVLLLHLYIKAVLL